MSLGGRIGATGSCNVERASGQSVLFLSRRPRQLSGSSAENGNPLAIAIHVRRRVSPARHPMESRPGMRWNDGPISVESPTGN